MEAPAQLSTSAISHAGDSAESTLTGRRDEVIATVAADAADAPRLRRDDNLPLQQHLRKASRQKGAYMKLEPNGFHVGAA